MPYFLSITLMNINTNGALQVIQFRKHKIKRNFLRIVYPNTKYVGIVSKSN